MGHHTCLECGALKHKQEFQNVVGKLTRTSGRKHMRCDACVAKHKQREQEQEKQRMTEMTIQEPAKDREENNGENTEERFFMEQFKAVQAKAQNGAFITSCICHSCPWSDPTSLNIDSLSVYQHYAAWMAGNTTGADSIHIDTRGPNGDGKITDPMCAPFPN